MSCALEKQDCELVGAPVCDRLKPPGNPAGSKHVSHEHTGSPASERGALARIDVEINLAVRIIPPWNDLYSASRVVTIRL